MKLFDLAKQRRKKFIQATEVEKVVLPDGLYKQCEKCKQLIYSREVVEQQWCCPHCHHYFRMHAKHRIQLLVDAGSFKALKFDASKVMCNPLEFPQYEEKRLSLQNKLQLEEAIVCGTAIIKGKSCVLCVMDSHFLMGSLSSEVGERLTQAIEYATLHKQSIIIFCASGGARMQEGIFSLMQMAKVSMALKKHSDEGQLYISVLTDPTTGGVTASFAMLGDIIIAEPKALIGFAGRRVIEQTMQTELPEDFQQAEQLMAHGFIDLIVERKQLRTTLADLLILHERE